MKFRRPWRRREGDSESPRPERGRGGDDRGGRGRDDREGRDRDDRGGKGPWHRAKQAAKLAAVALAFRALKRWLPGIAAVLFLLIVIPALTFAMLWQRAEHRARTAEQWTRRILDSLTTTVDFPVVPAGLTTADTLYWQWTAATARVQARGFQHALQERWRNRRSLMDPGDVMDLRRAGLDDPERQVADSLEAHPEIIPHPGALGGSMIFQPGEVVLLPGRLVWAPFEDGHVSGSMLLEYDVGPGGRLVWKVLWSRLD